MKNLKSSEDRLPHWLDDGGSENVFLLVEREVVVTDWEIVRG